MFLVYCHKLTLLSLICDTHKMNIQRQTSVISNFLYMYIEVLLRSLGLRYIRVLLYISNYHNKYHIRNIIKTKFSLWSIYCLNFVKSRFTVVYITKKGNLALYTMIHLLSQEAEMVNVQVRLVTQGVVLRNHRKKYKKLHNKLSQSWSKFIDGELSTFQLLKLCSRLNGPYN